ncbi:putative inorganic phosphate cotransporter isoform X2 [Hyposmocoma kahamanoa]|uniref:putative inorganic phosphate cotransporter isoform X2 n=1 Tax=Hyposmocoma kahamanoa TaxID=1477025 RepID=UPI000E6D8DB0|nr:putative inorganic phosphate cotransporter isoform X2 [Hyposmocoma kahamanoa]
MQALIIFGCLTCNLIARAHLSVTIVAMTDIPKHDIVTVLNNSGIDLNNMVYAKTNDSIFQNVGLDIANRTKDGREEINLEIKVNGTEVLSSKLNAYRNKSISDNTYELEKEFANNPQSRDSVWNVYRTYYWSKATQEMVLGSFFLGYLIMMTPMGLVVQRWGGKMPLQIGLTVSGIVTFISPWLAAWGDWKAVCAARIALGLAQTGTYPGIHSLLAKWVPLSERGRLSTYVYSGAMIGSVLAFQIGGFLAASPLGWPSIFWATGGICIIMAVLLTIFGKASPQLHKHITEEEKNFILGRVGSGVEKRQKTPWKAILTSKPAWALFIGHVGTALAYMFFFTQIPTYLHYILDVNVKSSGLLTSLPYLANFFMAFLFGLSTDYCINNNILTCKQTRMISNTVANVFPAICLTALSFTRSTTVAVILLIVALGTQAGCHTGWMVNYIDLAPNFSGTLIATGASLLNVFTILLPIFVSQVVTDVKQRSHCIPLSFISS